MRESREQTLTHRDIEIPDRDHTNGPQRIPVASFRLEDLRGEVTFLENGQFIVHQGQNGHITATRNRCRHNLGKFQRSEGCVLTCPNHGWQIDVSTMEYVNPVGIAQDQLTVDIADDGTVILFEALPARPWELDPVSVMDLEESELTVRFYSHACAEINCGPDSIFTDPWLVGPAFSRGWWLAHQPPEDWLDRLAAADAIYISHNHSDHLSINTLRMLAARNPQAPIFVPAFDTDSCARLVRSAGLENVTIAPFGVWVTLGEHARFMLLLDEAGRDDSAILVEYKGHRILDLVDCTLNLNHGELPRPVDVLLSPFAGGASGYPVCWPDQYSQEQIERVVASRRLELLQYCLDVSTKTNARVVVPFAGYFKEAHPADYEIMQLNVKNSPENVRDFLQRKSPDIDTWIPQAGDVFDVGIQSPVGVHNTPTHAPQYNFDDFLTKILDDLDFRPLESLDGVKAYFEWAGYKSDLVLHVIETDEDFAKVYREFYLDFSNSSFLEDRPKKPHRYLRMRVRADVFRHVLRWGMPWEEISIGFQARFYREPDAYNFDFWNHFQHNLPSTPPVW